MFVGFFHGGVICMKHNKDAIILKCISFDSTLVYLGDFQPGKGQIL